ncbi:Clavaminate synthase-like protein [Laetiporus sulphureus 93-53]|uniref:Clavaminate synthase-like protein n=1 Tax=Laetiporus sulphureus 93-53 TaxID=1314785 RepID=A0A165G9I0_9APHY|nr:Clavaminate synthase-like protein [Laetiporus sulphureus 93-53]KZT10025.1 Clavaminate synthase-like protein [Laetiporus sulphureus 93-53]
MPGIDKIPPFPEDVPTHPLLVVDYQLIQAGDENEVDKLWKAATQLGFWYLKNHGADEEVDAMFEMGAETMALPLDEKMQFEQGDEGISFGYKAAGVNAIDEKGNVDATEFINVSKDDALAFPKIVHRTYPRTVNVRMDATIIPFVRKSLEINATLLEVLNAKLGLPKGTLARLHKDEEQSGCVARVIKTPPQGKDTIDEDKALLSAHTDFGSLSFLHNRLGGLQVLAPCTDKWQYVKPLPGHAICNIGDSLHIFSGGILRSNVHRVIAPPKEQASYERCSLVFFTRANDSIELCPLIEESPLIANTVASAPNARARFWPGVTAKEWLLRRNKYQRINNFKGPESYKASLGTEDYSSITRVKELVAGETGSVQSITA